MFRTVLARNPHGQIQARSQPHGDGLELEPPLWQRLARSGRGTPAPSRARGHRVRSGGVAFLSFNELEPRRPTRPCSPPLPRSTASAPIGYLKKICEIGPRIAGSEANTPPAEDGRRPLHQDGRQGPRAALSAEHPLTGERVDMANLIGSWHPERDQRVVIGAHYDTRPHPDQETDPDRRKLPFLGANDGASGVALLMEIAHHLDELETPWGVDLVLFDGEELVYGNNPDAGEYFLGSKEFARVYADRSTARRTTMRYVAGMVLDMVGGQNLQINQEPNSLQARPRAGPRGLGGGAAAQGQVVPQPRSAAKSSTTTSPLNDAGIPTIDLIDFDYPYWHKADDLPENCSAESLAEVGRVVTAWLAQPRRRGER